MDGPYRDLGSGFARLTGVEGVRRSPSTINYVEDALLELLRNAHDAGAYNIYVASSLRARRFRTLTVLDDGHGIPEQYRDLVFDPGVTTRHATRRPGLDTTANPPGSGLALYHIKTAAVEARVVSGEDPTSVQIILDTGSLPERALQSTTRNSRSNLLGTTQNFLLSLSPPHKPNLYYGSPAAIAAALIQHRIIQTHDDASSTCLRLAKQIGLDVSLRTMQRILRNEVVPAELVRARDSDSGTGGGSGEILWDDSGQARLDLTREEISRIAAILGEAARTRYMEVGELNVESRPGEIVMRSRVYEPEEQYE
ncbi:hypothetical protein BH23ACT11_BH23ACT11_06180 [soil metagenome]